MTKINMVDDSIGDTCRRAGQKVGIYWERLNLNSSNYWTSIQVKWRDTIVLFPVQWERRTYGLENDTPG